MARGVGRGRLFEGDDYFKYFYQRRGAVIIRREAINRGTAVIQGNKVSLIMMMTMMMMMMMMIMLVMIKIVTEARGKSLIIKAY